MRYGPLTPYAAADLLTQVALLLRDAREQGASGTLTPASVLVVERDDGFRARLGALGPADAADDVQALGRVHSTALTGIVPTDPGADWLLQVLDRSAGWSEARYPDLAGMISGLRAAVVGIAAGSAVPSSLGGTPELRTEAVLRTEPVRRAGPPAADPVVRGRRSVVLPVVLALVVVLGVVLVLVVR